MAMHIVISMSRRRELFRQGDGRGVRIATAESININTRRRGCDSNPTEPAAVHAEAKENIIRIVNPKSDFVSAMESCPGSSDCNNFLWLT